MNEEEMHQLGYENILKMRPEKQLQWLLAQFPATGLEGIETLDDMHLAAKELMRYTGYYTYLCALLSLAKLMTRAAKQSGDRKEYEDYVDKKELISHMTDSVKQQYSAISRALTVRHEINAELRMNGSGGWDRQNEWKG